MSMKAKVRLGLFGAAGGAIGAGSYGWTSGRTASAVVTLVAVGALGGFVGGYLAAARLAGASALRRKAPAYENYFRSSNNGLIDKPMDGAGASRVDE